MEIFKRTLLALELIILCGPAVFMLAFGLLYSPLLLLATFTNKTTQFPITTVMVFFGTWGFVSLLNLVLHVFRKKHWNATRYQWLGIVMGIAACIIGLFNMKKASMLLFFIGPIIAGIHLLYLSKKYNQNES